MSQSVDMHARFEMQNLCLILCLDCLSTQDRSNVYRVPRFTLEVACFEALQRIGGNSQIRLRR